MRVGSIGPTRARYFRKLAAELTAIGGAARAGVEPANLSRKVG
jgi:hypothetical protein